MSFRGCSSREIPRDYAFWFRRIIVLPNQASGIPHCVPQREGNVVEDAKYAVGMTNKDCVISRVLFPRNPTRLCIKTSMCGITPLPALWGFFDNLRLRMTSKSMSLRRNRNPGFYTGNLTCHCISADPDRINDPTYSSTSHRFELRCRSRSQTCGTLSPRVISRAPRSLCPRSEVERIASRSIFDRDFVPEKSHKPTR